MKLQNLGISYRCLPKLTVQCALIIGYRFNVIYDNMSEGRDRQVAPVPPRLAAGLAVHRRATAVTLGQTCSIIAIDVFIKVSFTFDVTSELIRCVFNVHPYYMLYDNVRIQL